jgi:hypothetical protein
MDPHIVLPEVIGIGLGFVVLPAIAIEMTTAGAPHPLACPRDGQAAEVRLDRKRAALALFTDARQRVSGCSLWPERAECDRACEATL